MSRGLGDVYKRQGEDAEIYELVVGREESYFYDVRKFRFYTFMEETKK